MQTVKLSLFIFIIIPLSCSESPSTGFRFGKEINLTGKTLSVTDSVYLRYPFRIRARDSLFYMLDLHGPDFYCHTFTYPGLTLVRSFAPRGNGPDDFLGVESIRLGNAGDVYLLDANNETITIHNSDVDTVCRRIKLPKELIRSLDFTLINDSLFAIADYTGKCRIHIVDDSGIVQKQLFHIPTRKKTDQDISDVALAQAWRSFMDYNPDNGILAMATQLGQVIEIYDVKNNETVTILYGKHGEPRFAKRDGYAIPTGIMGYSDIHVGKEAIYAVFWGTSFKDIQKEPFNRQEGGNIIQIFSLDGKPLKQYTLDRHITGFSIDEENNKMIALDVNSDHQIIEYQL